MYVRLSLIAVALCVFKLIGASITIVITIEIVWQITFAIVHCLPGGAGLVKKQMSQNT